MSVVKRRRHRRRALAWAHLLLLVALLLGVGAMHTLGHAQEDPHHLTAPASVSMADAHAMPEPGGADPLPTDPTSMCLAVGGLVLALLGVAAVVFLHFPGPRVCPPSWTHLLAARFMPQPEPPSLAKLQVLRV